jgi:N-acetylglucosamine malate deacetylase 1
MPSVLAIAAHPDDIEIAMSGTMLHLRDRGWQLHYVNLADGRCGSTTLDPTTCAATRLEEARRAAAALGATFYGPLCRDMEILYSAPLLRQVAAIVRQARPSIVLTHAPSDYMEDHEQTCRLAVSAAFAHGMPNFATDPPAEAYDDPVTIYHAQPHGNATPLNQPVHPDFFVDTSERIEEKKRLLGYHESQYAWLKASQGMDSYIQTMVDLSAQLGQMSGRFTHAEGWRRHLHWGFCGPDDDPLRDALAEVVA